MAKEEKKEEKKEKTWAERRRDFIAKNKKK